MVGLLLGGLLIQNGGRQIKSSLSLELVADEQHIRERMLVADAAVVWAREVALERGWIDSESLMSVYKAGPVVVRVEVLGKRPEKMVERVSSELVAKYGFGRLVEIKSEEINAYSKIYVVVLSLVGLGIGGVISLIREYWRKY